MCLLTTGLLDATGRHRGEGGFELVATEQPPLVLANFLSYEEMALAALLVVSTLTHFINAGEKLNFARADGQLRRGVFVATVGARFECPGLMESETMLIDSLLCTVESGYGKRVESSSKETWLNMWAEFVGLDHLPTHAEADAAAPDEPGIFDDPIRAVDSSFVRVTQSTLLNAVAYTARMRILAEWCDTAAI